MKSIILVLTAISALLIACGASTQRLVTTKRLAPLAVIGFDPYQHINGYWSGTLIYHDGVGLPYDTIWSLGMRDPKYLAYDERFLLLKDAKGKMVIITTTPDGKPVHRSTKSEERYEELRTELSVPPELVLQEIK